MAGHNKWSKIKHKKAAADAQKSKTFGKLSILLTAEAKKCGGDKNSPGLKSVIDQAKAANMTNQNIDQAIQRGVEKAKGGFEEILYEAYGPGGCALLIKTETDNRNKTAAEVRHILSRNNCSLSAPGSVMWVFQQNGESYEAKEEREVGPEESEKLKKIIEDLKEQEEVQEVYANCK